MTDIDNKVAQKDRASEFAEKLYTMIEKFFGSTGKEQEPVERVTKSLDEEQRMALFVVLEPQKGDTTTDLHEDTYTIEEVEKACHNFGQHCMKANLFHKVETENAQILQNYTAPADFILDGKEIKKGTWLQMWHFPETEAGEAIWKAVKSGEINGVSIQCRAKTETIE